MRIDTDWTYILTHKWGVLVFYMQNTSAYEAWWRFIVKAVCFGQIRAPPIGFQVRYVLGGWCYIMAPLITSQHISMVSSLDPTNPSDLNPNCTWGILKILCRGVFCGWVGRPPVIFEPSESEAFLHGSRLQSHPLSLFKFSSGDIQGILGWAILHIWNPCVQR